MNCDYTIEYQNYIPYFIVDPMTTSGFREVTWQNAIPWYVSDPTTILGFREIT